MASSIGAFKQNVSNKVYPANEMAKQDKQTKVKQVAIQCYDEGIMLSMTTNTTGIGTCPKIPRTLPTKTNNSCLYQKYH